MCIRDSDRAETSAVDKAETFAVHTEESSSNDKAETPAFDETETPLWGQISRIHNPDPYLCFPPRLYDINNYQSIFYWVEGATGFCKGYRAVRSTGLACDQDPRKKFKLFSAPESVLFSRHQLTKSLGICQLM